MLQDTKSDTVNKTKQQKLLSIFMKFSCITVIILLTLGFTHVIPMSVANAIAIFLLGVMNFMNGIKTRKRSKKAGNTIIGCSIIIFALWILGLITMCLSK